MFSRNTLRATPVSPDHATFKGKVLEEIPFSAGGMEAKKLLNIKIGGVATTFVERGHDPYYIDAWQAFREAGLPVAPTLHRSSRKTLLVGDVKAEGGEVYGKSFASSVNHVSDQFRRSPEADDQFVRLMESNKKDIHEAAVHLAEVAARNAIRLPNDDPLDLRVQPNGEWDLVSLDLGGAVVPANLTTGNERFINDTPDPARFHEENLRYIRGWQSDLEIAREVLKRRL